MKKALLILLAVTLAALSACSTDGGGANTTDTEEITTQEDTTEATPEYTVEEAQKITADHKQAATNAFASSPVCSAEDLLFEEMDGGVRITGYEGDDLIVVIPDSIEGKAVLEIAEKAFKDMTALRAVCVPESVRKICHGAFDGCNGLTTLKLPYSAAIYDIFDEDGDKTSDGFFGYIFGASEYAINAAAVSFKLQTVIFTGEGKNVPEGAFYDCNDIVALTLPDGIEKIGDFAFSNCSSLEYVNIGDTATEIGEFAFNECASMLELTLPATTKSIGLGAVQGCGALTSVTLPFVGGSADENTYLGYIFGAESYTLAGGFFPLSLQSITLLEGCRSIDDNAFNGCLTVREIIIPDGVERIGLRAFRNCKKLTSMSLPDSLLSVGDSAFIGCESLAAVHLGKSLKSMGMQAFMGCGVLESITLPDSLEKIPASAFDSCTSLKTVSFGANVKEIGKNAFRGCTSITDFPAVSDNVTVMDGNTAIIK
ncbi:MAG: leucine-rich repeat domain-containing protein [Clostridia bacterium]|nr:leucine-rich repeat domain-containing protein [Clostridia bacterium]